jgi:hypothetical protein
MRHKAREPSLPCMADDASLASRLARGLDQGGAEMSSPRAPVLGDPGFDWLDLLARELARELDELLIVHPDDDRLRSARAALDQRPIAVDTVLDAATARRLVDPR